MYNSLKLTLPDSEGIAQVQLCRSAHKNAFDEELHGEFAAVLGELRAHPDIRCMLLHAEGPIFSAGGNFEYLRRLHDDPDLRRRTHREGYDIFALLHDMPVPIVTAVQGHAVGVGATIITSCDVIVAYKNAKIGDPHVLAGLVAGDGGALSWSAAAGATRAKRMLLTGQNITAAEAYTFGLVTDLVDTPEETYPAALAIAREIAGLPPMAVQGTKRIFNALARDRIAATLDVSLLSELATASSEDLLEALAAIAEKRKGVYRNR